MLVCPHAVIRSKVYEPAALEGAPKTFQSTGARAPEWKGRKYTLQIAPEDCTGCALCVDVCPARNKSEARLKAINMRPQPPLRESERDNWNFFLTLPEADRRTASTSSVRGMQTLQPLFEFSGACAGCGETPYVKLLSQLFGDRLVIANATGCTSIYGGNLPTTPWAKNADGRGPAWSNSLFEDNAEFGMGYPRPIDKQAEFARELVHQLAPKVGEELAEHSCAPTRRTRREFMSNARVATLKEKLHGVEAPRKPQACCWRLADHAGAQERVGHRRRRLGLRHRLRRAGPRARQRTQRQSARAGHRGLFQHRRTMSKSTPRGAVAKFAAGGKPGVKKDLGLIAMTYGNVYVAAVAMGAKDEQTLKAFIEAEAYDGPALDHRLQPLHRPRDQHDHRHAESEGGRASRPLAALPSSSRPDTAGAEPVAARFAGAAAEHLDLHGHGKPVQDAQQEPAGRSPETGGRSAGGFRNSLAALPAPRCTETRDRPGGRESSRQPGPVRGR